MNAAEHSVPADGGQQSWDLAFSAVELGGSASLGGDVRLDLAPRTTVLVGKNGAGKSLLLEKLRWGIWGALGAVVTTEPDPARLACEVDVRAPGVEEPVMKVHYECRWQARDTPPDAGAAPLEMRSEAELKLEETCRLLAPDEHLLWRVEDGQLTYDTGEKAEIAPGRTLLNWTFSRRGKFLFPNMAYPLRELFGGVIEIPAGVPRGDGEREELALPYPQPHRLRPADEARRRLRRLAYRLVAWHETDRGRFDEIAEIGRRTGLFGEIKVKLYRDPDAGSGAGRRDLVRVIVDGTDLGLLSDGTLRVAEILTWLLSPGPRLLLVEEPETAVHPGLLSKLLAEIDAYSTDRQVVLSTQSPQVVSWADPLAIRLVERRSGRTDVRRLRDDEVAHVEAYLRDEGTLGDFVYSGALDG